jgi:hypothetical protein
VSVAVIATLLFTLALSVSSAAQPMYLAALIGQDTGSQQPESSVPPTTPPHSSSQILVGPEVGVFFPTSSKTENAYGSSWVSIGVGLGSAYQAKASGSIGPFFNILYNTDNNNRAFVLPVGLAYRKAFSKSASSGYFGIDATVVAVDQKDVADNVHSGFNYGEGGRALLGYEIGKSAYVQAGYMVTSSIKTFNFSGASIETGYRF